MTSSTQSEPASPRKKTLSLALAVMMAGAVVIGSFLPGEEKQVLHSRGRFHALGHLLVFLAVGYLSARAVTTRRARILVFCGAVALGVAIEYGEHLVFRGWLERKDILVDTLGVVVGTLLASVTAPRE